MIIIWGSKLYGKVDIVPGLFHVETKFGHLWYIPLIPVETYLVLGKSSDGWNGIKIPMSFKSVLFAWLRAATLIAGIVFLIMALATSQDGPSLWAGPAIMGVCSLAIFGLITLHKGSTRASYDRACQLGEVIGLTPEGKQMIEQLYGFQGGEPDPFSRGNRGF